MWRENSVFRIHLHSEVLGLECVEAHRKLGVDEALRERSLEGAGPLSTASTL